MSERSASWRPGQTVCRCCLAEGCYKDISTEYFWMGKREVYADMLLDTFDVNISFSQAGGPGSSSRLICEPCISRLRDASEFKRQVLECEKAFVQQLEPGSSAIDVDDGAITLTGSEIKVEAIKLEKSLSDDEDFHDAPNFDDDDDDLDDQPLTTFASRVPKKESVDILELLDTEKTPEKRKMPVRAKATPAKKLKAAPKTVVAKAATSKTATKTGKVDTKKKGENSKSEQSAENTRALLENTTAYPFRVGNSNTIVCSVCQLPFNEPKSFRKHFNMEHTGQMNLVRLDRVLRVDIMDLRCRMCLESHESLDSVAEHLNKEHGLTIDTKSDLDLMPVKLTKDIFSCHVCAKKFISLKQLSKHCASHYGKHMCDACGRNFESISGLEIHRLSKHSEKKFFCVSCRTHFNSLDEKKVHIRTNEACLPFMCRKCNVRFLTWEKREEHMVELHGMVKKTFPCSECDKVYDKRIQLYLHFKSAHTEEFKCTHCGECFSTKRNLTDHVNRLHTGSTPYECKTCHKCFATQRNWRQHIVVHDDSMKQKCHACGKLFLYTHRLKCHIKKCHPEVYPDVVNANAKALATVIILEQQPARDEPPPMT